MKLRFRKATPEEQKDLSIFKCYGGTECTPVPDFYVLEYNESSCDCPACTVYTPVTVGVD